MEHNEALALLVISIGAFIIPFISERIFLPSAVGEIFFGLFLGLFFKNALSEFPIVKFLGEFGFILLMYLAGLEIDVDKIKKVSSKEKFLISILFIVIIISSFAVVFYFKQPAIYSLVYIAMAIGILYPLLKDTGLLNKDIGQKILVIGGVGEIISLLLITAFTVYFKYGFSSKAILHIFEIYVFFLVAYFLLKIFSLYMWWNPNLVQTFLKTGDVTETGIRANFAHMFIFVSLASLLGLESIIGAFFGGLLFSMVFKEREEIVEKLSAFGYGFLIPIFFIEVGLRFDITDFFDKEIFISALILSFVILMIKGLGSLFLIFSDFKVSEIFLVPFALSMPLTLLVVIATIGLETGIIEKKEATIILLTAIISALIYPWIFKVMVKKVNIE